MTDTANIKDTTVSTAWSPSAKVSFRIAFVFFALMIIPIDWKFWRQLFSTDWSSVYSVFHVTAYSPEFINAAKWGVASFANWGLVLVAAIAGGLLWGYLDRDREEYDDLYYWFRVGLRYRLAVGMIAYGVLMTFGLLFPEPTLSELNTNYADFLPWKIYYLTLGVASAHYEESLGIAALIGGTLLLVRQTAVVGAGIVASMLVNIVAAAFAYQLGSHVYASLLLLIATVLLAHDAPRLYDLLVRERPAAADLYEPVFGHARTRAARLALKSAVVVFAVVLSLGAYGARRTGAWQFPDTPGLQGTAGLYNVKEFAINGQTLPYSLVDPVRWQNVVFEPWNTISVRIHRPIAINLRTPGVAYANADTRDYETAGNGGRHFYSYTLDGNERLHLEGKNDKSEKLSFTYTRVGDRELILNGVDDAGNVLDIHLERTDKVYLLHEGRRRPVTLY